MLLLAELLLACLLAACVLAGVEPPPPPTGLSLQSTTLVIPQWDYQPAIYYTDADPYPHLDQEAVDRDTMVHVEHQAVVLENAYVRLVLLPRMGRVYSFVFRPTGNEVFWRNDVVTVGGGQNDTGWWLWIGGAEYTLPGDEHGTTWALPWDWHVTADTETRKAVRMEVEEPGTGLLQKLEISLEPARTWYQADITVTNPTDSTVHYAHWVNPQWAPGGQNELTDSTEFVIPTHQILIEDRWQQNMGPSPQPWPDNRLRFIQGWERMGDLMADGLWAGFYSAYSHDMEEGVARVFDPADTPGVDIWTYGYHPTRIPMGSGAPNKGYAEMWGGTSRTYPDERKPLAAGDSVSWSEWMYPYQRTGGLTFADRQLAVNFVVPDSGRAVVGICPTGPWQGQARLWLAPGPGGADEGQTLWTSGLSLRPDAPLFMEQPLTQPASAAATSLRLTLQQEGANALTLAPGLVPPPTE